MSSLPKIASVIPVGLREIELTPVEQLIRKAFVHEYMRDGDATAAAMRIGYSTSFATSISNTFLTEGYTSRLIADAMEEVPTIERQREVAHVTFNRMFMESGDRYNNSSSRISAAVNVARMLGCERLPSAETDGDDDIVGGVMQVPTMTNADEWSVIASKSQDRLKQDVRQ